MRRKLHEKIVILVFPFLLIFISPRIYPFYPHIFSYPFPLYSSWLYPSANALHFLFFPSRSFPSARCLLHLLIPHHLYTSSTISLIFVGFPATSQTAVIGGKTEILLKFWQPSVVGCWPKFYQRFHTSSHGTRQWSRVIAVWADRENHAPSSANRFHSSFPKPTPPRLLLDRRFNLRPGLRK